MPEIKDPNCVDPVVKELLDHQESMVTAHQIDKSSIEEIEFNDWYKASL